MNNTEVRDNFYTSQGELYKEIEFDLRESIDGQRQLISEANLEKLGLIYESIPGSIDFIVVQCICDRLIKEGWIREGKEIKTKTIQL